MKSTHDKDIANYRSYLETILISSGHDTMQELRKRIDFAEMSEQEFATTTWTAFITAIQRHHLAKPEPLRPPYINNNEITNDELHSIFVNSLGKHGGFLTSFAESYLAADLENVQIMRPAALALVAKYNLKVYIPHAFTSNPLRLDRCKHCALVEDHEIHN